MHRTVIVQHHPVVLPIFVGWSKKWNELVNKGPEYASLKSAWLNVTNEADQLAEIHSELQIRLCNQVHGNLQKWKSTNYHKSLLSWKETKSAEEGFMKAQKPWAKRHDEGTVIGWCNDKVECSTLQNLISLKMTKHGAAKV